MPALDCRYTSREIGGSGIGYTWSSPYLLAASNQGGRSRAKMWSAPSTIEAKMMGVSPFYMVSASGFGFGRWVQNYEQMGFRLG